MNDSSDRLQRDLEEIRKSSQTITNVLEKELIRSKYVINALANVLQEGLIVLDANKVICVMNEPASQLLSLDPADALGKNLTDVFPDAFNDSIEGIKHEWVVIDQSTGLPKYLDIVVSVLPVTSDSPSPDEGPAYVLLVRDITIHKANEYKVLDLSTFQNNLISSMPLPTFYSDMNGGYIRGSASFFDLVKTPRLKALSTNIDELLGKGEGKKFRDLRSSHDKFDVTVEPDKVKATLYKNVLKNSSGVAIGIVGCLVLKSTSDEVQE